MDLSPSAAGAAFAKVLRSFQTGGLAHDDFMARVHQQLLTGASRAELLAIVERREAVEPLPSGARNALVRLLTQQPDAPAADRGSPEPPQAASDSAAEVPTIVLEEADDTRADQSVDARAAAPPPPLALGDLLEARFRLIELIGEGGMSRVYKATDARESVGATDHYVAVKVFSRPLSEEHGAFVAFEAEVRILQSLMHPNIVRTLGCARTGAGVFLTMELLDGQSLYSRLRSGTSALDRDTAQSIVSAVADALDYAHGHHVVHGDLKPGNVILTERGEVKVIDFGIAAWIARPRMALERREVAQRLGASVVTPRYASPQLMARHKPEATDDVYALACLTYELFTGSHPLDHETGAGAHRYPPPLRAGLSATQYAAILQGLQFEQRDRTPSIARFLQEFSAKPQRLPGKGLLLWVLGVALAAVLGWFYGRPYLDQLALHGSVVKQAPSAAASAAAPRESAPATTGPSPASPALPTHPPPSSAPPRGSVLHDCPTCPALTVLPAGPFEQGAARDAAPRPEKPQHRVVIGYPLALGTNEVTVGEYREFVAATGHAMQGCDIYDGQWRHRAKAGWDAPGFSQTAQHPVTCVSWNDAIAYTRWLTAKTGHVYRLPSASEWEYAARAGSDMVHPWDSGASSACAYANVADQSAERQYPGWTVFACDDGYAATAPVGSFKANGFGLNDMLGNVFEWTQDCWHADYVGAPTDGSPRLDGDCTEHELRGGSWFSTPAYVGATFRNHFARTYRTSSVGFRLAREIDQ